jgi:hypothetical protein
MVAVEHGVPAEQTEDQVCTRCGYLLCGLEMNGEVCNTCLNQSVALAMVGRVNWVLLDTPHLESVLNTVTTVLEQRRTLNGALDQVAEREAGEDPEYVPGEGRAHYLERTKARLIAEGFIPAVPAVGRV